MFLATQQGRPGRISLAVGFGVGMQGGQPAIVSSVTSLTVSPAAGTITAGVAQNYTVVARDELGGTYTSYAGTVTFTSTDGAASLPANSTLTSGVGVFSATLKTAGSRTVTATDAATASITGTTTAITVVHAAAATYSVTGASGVTAGVSYAVTVVAIDAYANTATGYTGTVTFTSSDGAAIKPANSVLTNGAGTFTAHLFTAGSQSITATDTVTGTITGTKSGITVSAATTIMAEAFENSAGPINGIALDTGGTWSDNGEVEFDGAGKALAVGAMDAQVISNAGAGKFDGYIDAVLVTGAGPDLYFAVMFNSASDRSTFWIAEYYSAVSSLSLKYFSAGYTTKASVAIGIDPSTTYAVRVLINGDNVQVFINDIPQLNFTESSRAGKTQTYHGFYFAGAFDLSGTAISDFTLKGP